MRYMLWSENGNSASTGAPFTNFKILQHNMLLLHNFSDPVIKASNTSVSIYIDVRSLKKSLLRSINFDFIL